HLCAELTPRRWMSFRLPCSKESTLILFLLKEEMYAAVIWLRVWRRLTTIPVPFFPGMPGSAWPMAPLPSASAATLPGSSRRRRTHRSVCASTPPRSGSGQCGPCSSSQRETPWYRSSPPCPPDPPSHHRQPCVLLPVSERWSSSSLRAAPAISFCSTRAFSCPCLP